MDLSLWLDYVSIKVSKAFKIKVAKTLVEMFMKNNNEES